MAKSHFSALDIAIALFSLFTYVIDVGTDVAAGTQYFLGGQKLFGWLTAAFVLVPAIVMSIFSLTWHVHDKTVKSSVVFLHILPLAPVQRYGRVVQLGLMSRKSQKVVHTQRALRAQNDVSILRLIEAFMESAPQLVLQFYIMITSQKVDWFTGLAAGSSLLSLSWSMTAYSDSLRKAHTSKYQLRIPRLVWHWGWQLFMTGSRIAAFVFLASVIDQWLFAVMGGHWILAFLWISLKGTDFGNGFCEKWMFRMVCAFIYIFVFLNLNDGVSRWRITAFYVVVFFENAAMVIVYLISAGGDNLLVVSCSIVFGGFVLGLACMLIYYGLYHPTGRRIKIKKPFEPQPRMFSVSQTSVMFSPGGGVQVFNIDSPAPAKQSARGRNGNLFTEIKSPKTSGSVSGQLHGSDPSSIRHSRPPIPLDQQNLQQVWQNGIESSSSDSSSVSSLASEDILKQNFDNRPPSRNSNNSDNSANSDNCLIPPLTRNDLSKSSETAPKFQMKESVLMKKNFSGEVSGSDSVNIYSSTGSPTLSRGSWARSSDYRSSEYRPSHGVEEFVTLAFDDSSSTDRRGSDASSCASRPKSLSPLDVASLWHDVHSKLRQTIAATIAAATGSISSNEGTPRHNRSSVSHNTTASSHDENLSSTSHRSTSLENHLSNARKDDVTLLNGSINSVRQREGMCSLPDILEAVENEPFSDISGSETNYSTMACQNSGTSRSSSQKKIEQSASSEFGNDNTKIDSAQSPFPEDSTLTASKLLNEKPKSYLQHTHSGHTHSCENSFHGAQEESNGTTSQKFQGEEFSQDWISSTEASNDTSPFTDQELVRVMANSLQSYMGYSTPTVSISREREGLALTIDDLRFSPESGVDSGSNVVRTHSTSSLFHDSENSSPVSSASKMQRQVAMNKSNEKLSPDAFKHIHDFPLSLRETLNIQGLPKSQALSILREAYAHSLAATPPIKSSPKTLSSQSSHLGRKRNDTSHGRLKSPNDGKRERISIRYQDRARHPSKDPSFILEESERYCDEDAPYQLEGDIVLFDSIAWQKSKLMTKNSKGMKGHVHVGKSSTKKLNVHGSSFHQEEYASSPDRDGQTLEISANGGGSEEYVKGRYRPPLCEVQENISKNIDRFAISSLEKDSKRKQILALTNIDDHGLNLCDEDDIKILRREIMRQDKRRNHRESDFFNLHTKDLESSAKRNYSSVSQPNLRRNTQSLSPRKRTLLEESWKNQARIENSQVSYHNSTRSSDSCIQDHQSMMHDLETSGSRDADYSSPIHDSRNHRFSYESSRHHRRYKHFSQPDLEIHGSRPLHNSTNSYR